MGGLKKKLLNFPPKASNLKKKHQKNPNNEPKTPKAHPTHPPVSTRLPRSIQPTKTRNSRRSLKSFVFNDNFSDLENNSLQNLFFPTFSPKNHKNIPPPGFSSTSNPPPASTYPSSPRASAPNSLLAGRCWS